MRCEVTPTLAPCRGLAVVVAILIMAFAPQIRAQDGTLKDAKRLFKKGLVQYRLGKFELALTRFEAALKLANRPNIILNVAQCHRQLGHKKQALFFYKLYLTTWARTHPDKESPYKQEIAHHTKQLEAEIAAIKTGDLALSSTPPGAQIWLDGQQRPGITPTTLKGLALGEHMVELRKGRARFRGKVSVVALETAKLTATLTEVLGALAVSSHPPGAEILLDGKAVGKTPKVLTRLPLGHYALELRKAGHVLARRRVELVDSDPQQLSVTLQGMGVIKVRSNPLGAGVYIDDKLVGPAPIEHEVAPGKHKVRVVLANHEPHIRQVTLQAGGKTSIAAELDLLPEIDDRIFARRWRRTVAWIAMPLGICGGLAGAAMVVVGNQNGAKDLASYKNMAVQQSMDAYFADAQSAHELAVGGWVVIGASAALIAASIYLFASAPDAPAEQPKLDFSFTPLQGEGAAVTLGGAF
jgi:hypothetical protein